MTITQKLPKPSKADERDSYELVMLRDDGVCVRCHRTDHGIVSRDHRKNRSQGGLTTVANLQILCGTGTTGCHGYLTEHPLAALAEGWSVPSYAVPSEWPARRYLRSQYGTLRPVWVLYDDAGGFVEISDERARELMEGVAQMGTEVRASTAADMPDSEGLSGVNGRLGGHKTAPDGAETPCVEGLTPTEEGLMTQSTFTHRQTALGGAE